jgi:hypothetical protein
MRHPGAAQQSDPDAFQRITICDAGGQGSFKLVQWLGHVHSQPVVHRRFAGGEGLDIGTDYVDFSEAGCLARVIAMARKGLQVPLTRAFLGDNSHMVLMLSGSVQHDLTLVHRASEACTGLPTPPALVAVARDASLHDQPSNYAHWCGLAYTGVEADPEDPAAVWSALQPHLGRLR